MHKMSKESASSLAAAYGETAKWREAFDICMKYIERLNNCTDAYDCQMNVEDCRQELLSLNINTYEERKNE